MKSEAIANILSALNDECGRLGDDSDSYAANKEQIIVVLNAYEAIGKIRAEDVAMERLDRNGQGGALSWGGRSFAEHPDRCECQGNESTPHRHYDHAPYTCARCLCNAYKPVPLPGRAQRTTDETATAPTTAPAAPRQPPRR